MIAIKATQRLVKVAPLFQKRIATIAEKRAITDQGMLDQLLLVQQRVSNTTETIAKMIKATTNSVFMMITSN